MDEQERSKKMDEAIVKMINGLDGVTPGSQEALNQAKAIGEMYKARVEELKIDASASESSFARGIESEKIEMERSIEIKKINATKANDARNRTVDLVRVGVEVLKVALVLACIGVNTNNIMLFEQNGIQSSKAWGLLPAVKGLLKV